MAKYRVLEIYIDSTGVHLHSTEPQTIDNVVRMVRSLMPHTRTEWKEGVEEDSKIGVIFHTLRGRELEVKYSIMTYLGENSWEPFAVYTVKDKMGTDQAVHCFKRAIGETSPFIQ